MRNELVELVQSGLIITLALCVAGLICYVLKLRNDGLRSENKELELVIAAHKQGQQRLENALKVVFLSGLKALVLGRPEFELIYNLENDGLWSICHRKTNTCIVRVDVIGEMCWVSVNTSTGVYCRFFHLSESGKVLEMIQCFVSFPELIEV